MARVLVFANHKGGCAKTTSAANIGCALALLGRRVLLIDLDPQGNLGEAFGIDVSEPGDRVQDALTALPSAPIVWTHRPSDGELLAGGVHLLPCSAGIEELVSSGAPHLPLSVRELVAVVGPDYDVVLIDTPPGLGPLSSMALLAGDWVIVPARPADFDIGGAVKLVDVVQRVMAPANPGLWVLGVLITQSDRRWRLRGDTVAALEQAGLAKLRHEIPMMVRVGSAPRYGTPTVMLEPSSPVARAYGAVADDLAELLAIDPR